MDRKLISDENERRKCVDRNIKALLSWPTPLKTSEYIRSDISRYTHRVERCTQTGEHALITEQTPVYVSASYTTM